MYWYKYMKICTYTQILCNIVNLVSQKKERCRLTCSLDEYQRQITLVSLWSFRSWSPWCRKWAKMTTCWSHQDTLTKTVGLFSLPEIEFPGRFSPCFWIFPFLFLKQTLKHHRPIFHVTSLKVVFDGPLPPCCLLLSPHKRNKDHESWHDNPGWSTISFQRQVFTETGLCLCPLPEAQLKLLQPGCAKMPSKKSRKHLILQILSILWYLSCILLMCFCGRYHGNEASPTQTTNKPREFTTNQCNKPPRHQEFKTDLKASGSVSRGTARQLEESGPPHQSRLNPPMQFFGVLYKFHTKKPSRGRFQILDLTSNSSSILLWEFRTNVDETQGQDGQDPRTINLSDSNENRLSLQKEDAAILSQLPQPHNFPTHVSPSLAFSLSAAPFSCTYGMTPQWHLTILCSLWTFQKLRFQLAGSATWSDLWERFRCMSITIVIIIEWFEVLASERPTGRCCEGPELNSERKKTLWNRVKKGCCA